MKGRSPGSPGSLKRSNAVLDVVPPLKRQNAQEFGENLCQRDDSSANAATGGSVSSLCLPIHALPATAEYERMLSWDLKEECRHRGLRIGGSNVFMVNRLRAYDAAMSNNRELYNTPLASDDSDNEGPDSANVDGVTAESLQPPSSAPAEEGRGSQDAQGTSITATQPKRVGIRSHASGLFHFK